MMLKQPSPAQRVLFFALFLSSSWLVRAGTFFCDFDSDPPASAKIYGHAIVETVDGSNGNGVLKLTTAQRSQLGSFFLPSLDEGQPVAGFTCEFKALIGGGNGADGFSVCFAPDLPNGPIGEQGAGTGLIVTFNTYNSGSETAPGVGVIFNKKIIGEEFFPGLRTERFVDVLIQLNPEGQLRVAYDGSVIFTNLPVGTNRRGRFAFGARTGDSRDNHFIDDLKIMTQTAPPAFLKSFLPTGDHTAPDTAVEITLHNFSAQMKLDSLILKLDGVEVFPVIATNSAGLGLVQYQPLDLLPPGSSHQVELIFADGSNPPKTNAFSYGFTVSPHVRLSP